MDEFTRKLSREIRLTHIPTNETFEVSGQYLLFHALLESIPITCIASRELAMFYSQEWAGMYKGGDVVADVTDEMVPILKRFFALDGNIPTLQREFQMCESKYFYIPLALLPTVTTVPLHANGLLVHRSEGTVYRIEPELEVQKETPQTLVDIESKIDKGILTALDEIGVPTPKLYDFGVTCPQAIAKDQNCMFWTAYIVREILRQIDSKEPREVVRELTANRPDIESFKEDLRTNLIPQFLAQKQVTWNMDGGMYWPLKYHRGLTRRQNLQRKRTASRRTNMSFKDPNAYVPFKSDKGVKTRKSSYTERFHKKYPDAKSLGEIAKATGISKSILQTVYDRGMAAWRTGHRPGASQQAWGMARVHSFVMKGKTYRTADSDLARKQ